MMQQKQRLDNDNPLHFTALDTLSGHTDNVTALTVISESSLASGSSGAAGISVKLQH